MTTVTRKRRSSRAERRDEITAALLMTVERLLKHESWTDLSVERLCAESGVPRSTFYMFFENQGALLTVLADETLGMIVGAGEAWWSLPREADRDDLVAAVGSIFDAYAEHGVLLSAVMEAASYDEGLRKQSEALMERSFSAVTDHISRAQAEGWMDPALDADSVAHWLSWMGESGLRAMLQRGERPKRRMLEAYADIVWSVLYTYGR